MKRFAYLFFLLPGFLSGQMTLRVTDLPDHYNPILDTLHVAGTFNNWNPSDPAFALVRQPDGSYTAQIPGNSGDPVEYKYTRGDWDRVETTANDGFRPNRTATYAPNATLTDTVARWQDLPGTHTPTGDVRLLDANFPLPQFNTLRRIWMYLPPDYATTNQSFPVLYMLDGQNLFDVATTAFGTEWRVDESLENIHANGGVQAIVVGIDNGGASRIAEYTPWTNPTYGGGDGEKTVDFIISELKPYIDTHFRTVPGRSHTGIAGSSLGGWMALYAAVERPDVFSKAGVFSPSFWYSDSCYQHVAQTGHQLPMRIYMVAGDQESASMVPNMYAMRDTLLAAGFSATELNVANHSDGQHSEWYWAREFPGVYEWLFDGLATSNAPAPVSNWRLVSHPGGQLEVQGPEGQRAELRLFDLAGREVWKSEVEAPQRWTLPGMPAGTYVAVLAAERDSLRQKLIVRW